MEACERTMLQGHCQFLLCHYHPQATTILSPKQFRSVHVGDDILLPVSVPISADNGAPLHALPGKKGHPVACLTYSAESGMGRILTAVRKSSPLKADLKPVFSSHLAKLLVTMALEQRGMAWLPKSLIEDQLQDGRLVLAGKEVWNIPIEIHIIRPVTRQTPVAEQFWTHLTNRRRLEC